MFQPNNRNGVNAFTYLLNVISNLKNKAEKLRLLTLHTNCICCTSNLSGLTHRARFSKRRKGLQLVRQTKLSQYLVRYKLFFWKSCKIWFKRRRTEKSPLSTKHVLTVYCFAWRLWLYVVNQLNCSCLFKYASETYIIQKMCIC